MAFEEDNTQRWLFGLFVIFIIICIIGLVYAISSYEPPPVPKTDEQRYCESEGMVWKDTMEIQDCKIIVCDKQKFEFCAVGKEAAQEVADGALVAAVAHALLS